MTTNKMVELAIKASALLAVAVIATPASAQVYVGAGAGYANSTGINGTTSGVTFTGDASRVSWKVEGGYQFTPLWGAQLQYTDLGRRTVTGSSGGVTGNVATRADEWGLAGTLTMPLGEGLNSGFSVLAKLGATRNHFSGGNFCVGASCVALAGESKTQLLAGAGLGYNINKNVSLRLEYENFGKFSSNNGGNGGAIKGDNWGLNLVYSF